MIMNRVLKYILVTILIIVAVPIAVFYLYLFVVMPRHNEGSWPFKPLDQTENTIDLSNGGVIRIEAIEQRGFRSDGWSVSAQYRAPRSSMYEDIGGWEGYNHDPKVYLTDGLLVLLNPDKKTIHVRTNQNRWKFFKMIFPDRLTSLPITFYTGMTTLTAHELSQIDPKENGWTPSVYVEEFDPVTREIIMKQLYSSTVRYIHLQLSEDGSDLELIGITN